MPELKMWRRVPGATQIRTWQAPAKLEQYFLGQRVRADVQDTNQDLWTVFSISAPQAEFEKLRQSSLLSETSRRGSSGLHAPTDPVKFPS